MDAKEVPIERGDVVFIPRGHDHRIRNAEERETLELVFLLDKATLTRPCPELERLVQQGNLPRTTEEMNRISRKCGAGTIVKTLE